jgi:hypothetical protein
MTQQTTTVSMMTMVISFTSSVYLSVVELEKGVYPRPHALRQLPTEGVNDGNDTNSKNNSKENAVINSRTATKIESSSERRSRPRRTSILDTTRPLGVIPEQEGGSLGLPCSFLQYPILLKERVFLLMKDPHEKNLSPNPCFSHSLPRCFFFQGIVPIIY